MSNYLFSSPYHTFIVKAENAFDATVIVNQHLRQCRLIHRYEEINAMKLEITKTTGIVTEKIGLDPWSDQYL